MDEPDVTAHPAPTPDGDPTPAVPGPTPAIRSRRFSRVLVALVVVAMVLAAGAGLLARSTRTDRRRAIADRSATSDRLDAQQSTTDAAQTQLDQTRHDAATAKSDAVTPLTTAQRAVDLANQGMVAYRDMQRSAESGSASVYNAALRRANDLVKQYNEVIQQFVDQTGGAGNPATPA